MNDVSGRGERLEALATNVERYVPTGRYDIDLMRKHDLNEAIAIVIGLPLTQRIGDPALGNDRVVPTRISDYVGSLDAAATLAPKGWDWCMGVPTDEPVNVAMSPAMKVAEVHADAATPALALTAACLRAIATQADRP